MTTSPAGIRLIKESEGLRLKCYMCPAGAMTVGYGHTDPSLKGNDPAITEEQADALLAEDLKKFEDAVNKAVTVPMTQGMFDALVSFTFNLGVGALRSSTLLRRLNSGDINGAAEEFKRWVFSGNKALPGLTIRRNRERRMFLGQ